MKLKDSPAWTDTAHADDILDELTLNPNSADADAWEMLSFDEAGEEIVNALPTGIQTRIKRVQWYTPLESDLSKPTTYDGTPITRRSGWDSETEVLQLNTKELYDDDHIQEIVRRAENVPMVQILSLILIYPR